MNTDDQRVRFEGAIFAHYERIKSMGWATPEEGAPTREALFWLQPNGQYGVTQIEAAWWGWQMAVRDTRRPKGLEQTLFLKPSDTPKLPRMHVVFPDRLYEAAVREGLLDPGDPTVHRYSDLQPAKVRSEDDDGVRP